MEFHKCESCIYLVGGVSISNKRSWTQYFCARYPQRVEVNNPSTKFCGEYELDRELAKKEEGDLP